MADCCIRRFHKKFTGARALKLETFKAFRVRTVLVAQIGRPAKDGTARIRGILNGSIMKCP